MIDRIKANFNKLFSKYTKEAKSNAKLDKCRICGTKSASFCNSHSIPQMILRNIDDFHKFKNPMNGLFPLVDNFTEFGIKNAGTFHNICNKCDQMFFRDYENEQFFDCLLFSLNSLSDKIIAEIMLKTALLEYYKKSWNKEFYKIINKEAMIETAIESDELSIKEYNYIIDKCIEIINTQSNNNFNIIYYDILDHKSEMATQSFIPLQEIPTKEVINDVFNMDPNYKIVDILAICYPWKEKTILFLISFNEDKERLNPFIKYFNSLNAISKRKLFQCMVFSLTEEVYLSSNLSSVISNDFDLNAFKTSGLGVGQGIKDNNDNIMCVNEPKPVSLNGFRKAKLYL